jgi:hypothetical protein
MRMNVYEILNNKNELKKLVMSYAKDLVDAGSTHVHKAFASLTPNDSCIVDLITFNSGSIAIAYKGRVFRTPTDVFQNYIDSDNKQEFLAERVRQAKEWDEEAKSHCNK